MPATCVPCIQFPASPISSIAALYSSGFSSKEILHLRGFWTVDVGLQVQKPFRHDELGQSFLQIVRNLLQRAGRRFA
jgi:hypothetical protein